MSDEHKFVLANTSDLHAYIFDKTSDSELVIIDKKTDPPTTARFTLLEKNELSAIEASLSQNAEDISTANQSINQLAALLPTSYLGQVSNRTKLATHKRASGGSPMMARSKHIALDNIYNPQIIYAAYYAKTETTAGNAATVTASIEYPVGTFTQAKFGGNVTGTLTDGVNNKSDTIQVTIPYGATFYVRTYMETADGTMLYHHNDGVITGDCYEYGAGTTDKTMGGTITTAVGSDEMYFPAAIIAYTRKPSVLEVGDSRVRGITPDFAPDKYGNIGEMSPTIGQSLAYLDVSFAGESGSNFKIHRTGRMDLSQYCSCVLCDYDINGLNGGNTAAATKTIMESIAAYFASKKFFLLTLPPITESTDAWATLENQTPAACNAQRIIYNDYVRNNQIAGVDAYFEIADIVESARNSGLWKPLYTVDGIHENTLGGMAIKASGNIKTEYFKRI